MLEITGRLRVAGHALCDNSGFCGHLVSPAQFWDC
jgi:hypothetical protein